MSCVSDCLFCIEAENKFTRQTASAINHDTNYSQGGNCAYADDTECFFRDLAAGVPMMVLAAPAVMKGFTNYRRVFGYLNSLGVRSFHNVLLRADIAVWAYVRWIQQHPQQSFVSSPCAAISAYAQQYNSQLLPYLLPVKSPLVCALTYLRYYRGLTERVVFLSPCVAKRRELREIEPLSYNVTLSRLQQYLCSMGINLAQYPERDFNDAEEGHGQTLAVWGGVCECLAAHVNERRFIKISGQEKVYPWLQNFVEQAEQVVHEAVFVEAYNCRAGCEGGTGVAVQQRQKLKAADVSWTVKEPAIAKQLQQNNEKLFAWFDCTLELNKFLRYREK